MEQRVADTITAIREQAEAKRAAGDTAWIVLEHVVAESKAQGLKASDAALAVTTAFRLRND